MIIITKAVKIQSKKQFPTWSQNWFSLCNITIKPTWYSQGRSQAKLAEPIERGFRTYGVTLKALTESTQGLKLKWLRKAKIHPVATRKGWEQFVHYRKSKGLQPTTQRTHYGLHAFEGQRKLMTWSWETSVVRSHRKCPFRAESYVLERSSTGVMTVLSCASAVGRQAVLEKDGRGCLVAWVKGSPEGTGKPPKKDARDVQKIWLVPEKGVLDGQLATGILSHGRHRMSIRAARERSGVWLSPGKGGTHSPFPRQVSGWSSAELRGLYLCVNAPVEVVTRHTVLITESTLGSNTAAGLFPTRLSRRGWRPSWRAWEKGEPGGASAHGEEVTRRLPLFPGIPASWHHWFPAFSYWEGATPFD